MVFKQKLSSLKQKLQEILQNVRICSEHLSKKLSPPTQVFDIDSTEDPNVKQDNNTEPHEDALKENPKLRKKRRTKSSEMISPPKSTSFQSPTPSSSHDEQSSPSLIKIITSPHTSRDLLSPGYRCVREWSTKRADIASTRSPPKGIRNIHVRLHQNLH